MKRPYVIGELRQCAACPAMFPRGPRRRSYCPACYKTRRKAWEARATAKKKQGATLPRGGRRGHYKQTKPRRGTERKPLPFCPICHRYNGMCEHQMVIYG